MSDTQKVDIVEDQGAENRSEAIEKIYGEEGVALGNVGEKTFEERKAFDDQNPNASMVSQMVGEANAEHDLARSTPDTKADNV